MTTPPAPPTLAEIVSFNIRLTAAARDIPWTVIAERVGLAPYTLVSGAMTPEQLIKVAAALGVSVLQLCDTDILQSTRGASLDTVRASAAEASANARAFDFLLSYKLTEDRAVPVAEG